MATKYLTVPYSEVNGCLHQTYYDVYTSLWSQSVAMHYEYHQFVYFINRVLCGS